MPYLGRCSILELPKPTPRRGAALRAERAAKVGNVFVLKPRRKTRTRKGPTGRRPLCRVLQFEFRRA